MTDTTSPAPAAVERARRRPARSPSRLARWRLPLAWVIGTFLVIVAGVGFVAAVRVRPAYDAYGWLVWGLQGARLHLDTNAAPSWKPLTFLFTFPYGLAVGRSALWVWMVTAAAAGLAAPVFAARIAYRLTAAPPGRRYAAVVAALFAGAGVAGLLGYSHFMFISTADPMMVGLSLAAIDAALSRHPSWAWLALVLLCLGRPEGLPAALVYAVWAWRRVPALRLSVVAGLAAIPLLWFGVPALTSRSWFIAGKVLDASTSPVPGNKLIGVLDRFTSLYELPMQIAALCALAFGVLLRLRAWLLMVAAATSWLAVEVALAYQGSGIAPRYMFEPAAVIVVLVGAGVGQALAFYRGPLLVRPVAVAAVLGLGVALVPVVQRRVQLVHTGIVLGQVWARQIRRLHTVIARDGGPKRILACGQPVTTVSYQSILAWELEENVIDVGWEPKVWTRVHVPMVLFAPQGAGWQVRPIAGTFPRQSVTVRPSADRNFTDARTVHVSVQTFLDSRRQTGHTAAACRRLFATTAVN